jgi:hypothetical protein
MTHDEWIQHRVAELLMGIGKIERDMEGEALVSLGCLTSGDEAYRAAVGAAPPGNLDKAIAAAYWDAVARDVPLPPPVVGERERMLAAVRRFEEEMGLRTPEEPKP